MYDDPPPRRSFPIAPPGPVFSPDPPEIPVPTGALPEANEILAPSLWKGVDEQIYRKLNPPPPPPTPPTLSTFEGFMPPGMNSFGQDQ